MQAPVLTNRIDIAEVHAQALSQLGTDIAKMPQLP
jgi:hypothetical protein